MKVRVRMEDAPHAVLLTTGLPYGVAEGSPKEVSPRRGQGENLGIWEVGFLVGSTSPSLPSTLGCCDSLPGEKHPLASLIVLPVSSNEQMACPEGLHVRLSLHQLSRQWDVSGQHHAQHTS